MSEKPTIERAEAEVAAARDELAGTVDELAARLDVPTRAKARTREITRSLRTQATEAAARPQVRIGAGAGLAVAVAAVAVLLWRRSH